MPRYVCTHVYMYVGAYVRTYVRMHACMYVYMYVSIASVKTSDLHIYIPKHILCDWCDYAIENPMRFDNSWQVIQMFLDMLFS